MVILNRGARRLGLYSLDKKCYIMAFFAFPEKKSEDGHASFLNFWPPMQKCFQRKCNWVFVSLGQNCFSQDGIKFLCFNDKSLTAVPNCTTKPNFWLRPRIFVIVIIYFINYCSVRSALVWYKVCHGFRLTKRDDYFWVDFDHFWIEHYFLR